MIENFLPLAEALEKLFSPLTEVVFHDVATGKITHIFGALSERQVGDDSLIDYSAIDFTVKPEAYTKLNFDGRLIKSISVPLKEDGRTKVLMCINCDISVFELMHNFSRAMLANKPAQSSLFILDWQEEVNKTIHAHIKAMAWDFKNLSIAQKKALVEKLFTAHAFLNKNAPDYVAKTLNMGRATIFNYLKAWRADESI